MQIQQETFHNDKATGLATITRQEPQREFIPFSAIKERPQPENGGFRVLRVLRVLRIRP
jgi:hypothetical protein